MITDKNKAKNKKMLMNFRKQFVSALMLLVAAGAAAVALPRQASAQTTPSKPAIAFAPHPNFVMIGQPATLVWTTTNAASCAASMSSGGSLWLGPKAVSGPETIIISVSGSGVGYILTCTSPDGGQASQRVVIYGASSTPIPSPILPTVDITAYPSSVTAGQNVTLHWATVDASSCTASGDWSGAKAFSGSEAVTPKSTSNTYTVTCTNSLGSTVKSVTVAASSPDAPVVSLSASRTTVALGLPVVLSWNATNANSCLASGASDWSGSVAVNGTKTVVPAVQPTTIYSLTCSNAVFSARSVATIGVLPADTAPPVIFAVYIAPPTKDSATLSWYTAEPADTQVAYGLTSAYGSMTPLDPGLTQTHGVTLSGLSPGTLYYYQVRNRDESGNLGLVGPGTFTTLSLTPPTLTFAPDLPTPFVYVYEVSPGQTLALNWSSANVTSCEASNQLSLADWSGPRPLAGSQTITVSQIRAANYTYSLACTGSNGSVTKRFTVYTSLSTPFTPTPTPPPAPTLTFSSSATSITSGQSSTLSWSSTNAAPCTASGGWSGAKSTSGTQSVSPTSNTTYNLSCTGSGGSVSKSVTITVLAIAPPPLTITFRPRLEGRGDLTGLTFTIRIFPAGGSTPITTFTGNGSSFVLPPSVSLTAGNYDFDVSAPYYLRKRHYSASFSSGADFTLNILPAGDLNQDNTINSLDWSVMSPKWFASDPVSDINRDGVVNSIDFSLLNRNWGRSGE